MQFVHVSVASSANDRQSVVVTFICLRMPTHQSFAVNRNRNRNRGFCFWAETEFSVFRNVRFRFLIIGGIGCVIVEISQFVPM